MLLFFIGRGSNDVEFGEDARYYVTDYPIDMGNEDTGQLAGMQYEGDNKNQVVPVYENATPDPQYVLETFHGIIAQMKEALDNKQFVKHENGRSIYFYKGVTIKQEFAPARWYQYKIHVPGESYWDIDTEAYEQGD